jgi:hypothetical protein
MTGTGAWTEEDRERVVQALYEHDDRGSWGDAHGNEKWLYQERADAVLAVLPAPSTVDEVRQAADEVRAIAGEMDPMNLRGGRRLRTLADRLDRALSGGSNTGAVRTEGPCETCGGTGRVPLPNTAARISAEQCRESPTMWCPDCCLDPSTPNISKGRQAVGDGEPSEREVTAGVAAIRGLQRTRLLQSLKLTEASCRAIARAVLRARESGEPR